VIGGSAPAGDRVVGDQVVCPYLGLAADPRTHFAFSTVDHRCHSGKRPRAVEVTHQVAVCLSANYPACRRYPALSRRPARPATSPVQAEAPVAWLREAAGARQRSASRRRFVAGAFITITVTVILAIILSWVISHPDFLRSGPFAGFRTNAAGSSSETYILATSLSVRRGAIMPAA